MKRKRLGEILQEAGLVSEEQIQKALKIASQTGKRIGKILIEMEWVSELDICQTLSKQLGIPMVSLKNKKIDPKVLGLLPAKLCFKRRLVPLIVKDRSLVIAMNNPIDYEAMDEVSFASGHRVRATVALEQEILDVLVRSYPPDEDYMEDAETGEYRVDLINVIEEIGDPGDISPEKLEKAAKGGVIRQLTNGVILNAVRKRASDIHIEPQEDDVAVRYRIDGMLRDIMAFDKSAQAAVVSRIKIMASLDITIRAKPQDGSSRVRIGENVYDLRVSLLPTFYGEKVVIRILESQGAMALAGLGMREKDLEEFERLLSMPQGLILVTGPTGSGKTTTLYAVLQRLLSPEINIVTIEDPIEYSVHGINQVQVNPARGLTFAKGLRSLLRQDPNVVMIGEIRDLETATIALQAAQTGHLVLSTLHTNDAVGAVTRLKDIGIEPYVIAASLIGVVAQRLVRKIHEPCSAVTEVTSTLLSRFGGSSFHEFKKGKGCLECQGTGYKGRVGIYELLVIDDEIGTLISERAVDREILQGARRSGMKSMTEDGFEKAGRGMTTLEELMRTAPPSDTSPIGSLPSRPKTEKPVEHPPDPQVSLSEKGERPPSAIRRDRIMIVDDDEAIRRYAGKVLESEYYEVIPVENGKDALNRIFENPPDLVLVDYKMPEMNGLEFIEKLKNHSHLSRIPTIMLTSTDTEETEIQALNVGADDWIQKPIHKARLLARIKRLLKSKYP
jgi:type IV pilus assembly protein PilB